MKITRAPGKIILFGEYAVLEGFDALVVAVDRYATCAWRPADTLRVHAPGYGELTPTTAVGKSGLDFIEAALTALPAGGGDFVTESDRLRFVGVDGAIRKLGLGSSAASTVAFVAAYLSANQGDSDHPTVFRFAQNAHRQVQSVGSGADIAAATYGGALRYRWTNSGDNSAVHCDAGAAHVTAITDGLSRVLGVWSGQPASTSDLVPAIQAIKDRKPDDYRDAISTLADAAQAGLTAWTRDDRPQLCVAATVSTAALRRLGEAAGAALVTDTHVHLAQLAQQVGGTVKPTGAGGGDVAWAIGPTPEADERLYDLFTEAGHPCWWFAVAHGGVRTTA